MLSWPLVFIHSNHCFLFLPIYSVLLNCIIKLRLLTYASIYFFCLTMYMQLKVLKFSFLLLLLFVISCPCLTIIIYHCLANILCNLKYVLLNKIFQSVCKLLHLYYICNSVRSLAISRVSRVSFPAGTISFFLSTLCLNWLWIPPTYPYNEYWGLFPLA